MSTYLALETYFHLSTEPSYIPAFFFQQEADRSKRLGIAPAAAAEEDKADKNQ